MRLLRPYRRAAVHAWGVFIDWFNRRGLDENTILLAFAVAIGCTGALGVVAFYKLIDIAFLVLFRWPAQLIAHESLPYWRPVVTAAGFAAAWWVMRRFARGHDGLTVPDVQVSVARRGGYVPGGPAAVRTAASAITLGSGGSAGSEGPVAVLGSAIGSVLARLFRFDTERVRVLVAAGAAAGISAAFNAPLAGAFFALEEILGSLAVRAFPPVVVASVVAAVVSHSFFGNHPAFPIPEEYGYVLTREVFLFYPLLGVITGLVSVLFIRTYFAAGDVARRTSIPPAVLPWVSGFLVGLMVLATGGVLVGYGHLAVRVELFGGMQWYLLALLALGKIVATSITLQGGGSGGVFTPSLYVGAVTGGAFGVGLTQLFPSLGLSPEAYALVGMGAVVAAATSAPITGILIVFEMTNDYAIVLPLMLTTVIAYQIARHIEPDSLYSGWLRRRGERIEHGTAQDVLSGLRVRDALEPSPRTIHETATMAELLVQLDTAGQTDFPVVDDAGRLTGIITVAELGRVARDCAHLADVLVATDIAVPTVQVAPDDSLREAVRRLGVRGAPSLPVVDPETGRLVGIVTRTHILAVYERALTRLHTPSVAPGAADAVRPSS